MYMGRDSGRTPVKRTVSGEGERPAPISVRGWRKDRHRCHTAHHDKIYEGADRQTRSMLLRRSHPQSVSDGVLCAASDVEGLKGGDVRWARHGFLRYLEML
jgi:hypothetical protein